MNDPAYAHLSGNSFNRDNRINDTAFKFDTFEHTNIHVRSPMTPEERAERQKQGFWFAIVPGTCIIAVVLLMITSHL